MIDSRATMFPHQPVDYARRQAGHYRKDKTRLYRGDIERMVWQQTGVPRKYCQVIIRELVKQIVYHVARGHKFRVPWFGILHQYRQRAGNGKIVPTVRFRASWGMREDLDLESGQFRKSCLNFARERRPEMIARASAPVPIERSPFRPSKEINRAREAVQTHKQVKIDRWKIKKRRRNAKSV